MGFKLSEKDCVNVNRGDYDHVYEEQLGKLYNDLANANEINLIYRLQGRIAQLQDVMSLKDKAFNQLN